MSKSPYAIFCAAFLLAQAVACQTPPHPLTPNELGRRFVEAVNSTDDALREAVAGEVYAPATLEKMGLHVY
ncbi:MAG: hypothetical protein L6Q97_04000 [Thermoanaerobaculia bacterium]|nr:hypothetical protein [Thermoanaerobaculia bacterium]